MEGGSHLPEVTQSVKEPLKTSGVSQSCPSYMAVLPLYNTEDQRWESPTSITKIAPAFAEKK